MMALCVAVFILMQIAGDDVALAWLGWPADASQYFQVWRWLSHARTAQAFVDYMATRGVTLRIEQESHFVIVLDDESQLQMVENELAQFVRDPNHPRYQAASWRSGRRCW
ncbi:hypothetical protein CRX72_26855 [Pantoea sp. BRM17]|nr:hypothetical protein CRX72_26855 [Pantoea sp. BRM17]